MLEKLKIHRTHEWACFLFKKSDKDIKNTLFNTLRSILISRLKKKKGKYHMRQSDISKKDVVFACTATIFNKYKNDYVDSCWHATQDLKQELLSSGISGYVVKGMVFTSFGEIQHHWIVVDEYVCDPTVQQLNSDQFFFKDSHDFYLNYQLDTADWAPF